MTTREKKIEAKIKELREEAELSDAIYGSKTRVQVAGMWCPRGNLEQCIRQIAEQLVK